MDSATILDKLETLDPILAQAGKQIRPLLTPIIKQPVENYLSDLCESIVSQQLSVKAASTIWSRTHAVIGDWNNPIQILSVELDCLRSCGLSGQKALYVKNIADAVLRHRLHLDSFDSMTDQQVIAELVNIKGIGQWTSEMFLIFSLGRQDIFSGSDLGLRNAIKKLYNLPDLTPQEAIILSEKWSPFRSTASRILWKTLDNEPLTN